MPATRPRASFEPVAPDLDVKALVESTPNFSYVDRISCDMIDQQGLPAFEKLVLLHVVIGGKPLVIDGFEDRLDPWTFTPTWLRDNCGDKHEDARNLTSKENLPLTMAHYLRNMGMMTNQFFARPDAYREQKRQRVYLKDIDCPDVWRDKLREHIPSTLFYLNESTGDYAGPGAQPDPASNRRLGRGIARAGDLMSSLPPDMRAENLMCYIGHEGTYTPAHREMCASLGHNIMVEASSTLPSFEDGKPEKPGCSIWFMTESKDRHTVSEYWLSVLGHDIEVENHFAQVVAWKKAPFSVYVVEQRPGDFILIPPLAPHQVWNRGTRTMKVAWNRTTVETLEMALNEALPRSRIVCRDEQYKNKAIVYYTLQKYSSLLALAQKEAEKLPTDAAQRLVSSLKIKQLAKDFRRLFNLYKQILLSEMFDPDDSPKGVEYLPFDSNVTCAYCRGNVFNRFLTCPSCKDLLGHHSGEAEGDPYDVCMDCYAMGRSCGCISGLKWAEQFRWKELASKYEGWRRLIIQLDGGQVTNKTPLSLLEEKEKLGKKTLAEVCKEQLKKRPWKDVRKQGEQEEEGEEKDASNGEEEEEEEEIIVDDNGMVKKIQKKRTKAWLKNNSPCHVCCKRHPNWKMAQCTTCERMWCYGTLFRGWDKMPITIMEDQHWSCPHCLGICFAGNCRREGKMTPYEPKGTLLGHDTRKVADARSVEALVDFSVSNLNWLKDGGGPESGRQLKRAGEEARLAKEVEPTLQGEDEEDGGVEFEESSPQEDNTPVDPAIVGDGANLGGTSDYDDDGFAQRLRQANESMTVPASSAVNGGARVAPDGYAAATHAGYVPPMANMYPQPDERGGYSYPGYLQSPVGFDESGPAVAELRPFKRRRDDDDGEVDDEDISMTKNPRTKKSKLAAAGFRSSDLASDAPVSSSKANKKEAQRQFEKEKERQAVEKAKSEGRFIIYQAALKRKKRIVILPIPSHRLHQLAARLAAKAALDAGEEADAHHEVEDGAAQQLENELVEDTVLLKSDIAPKVPPSTKAYYQQRQREGHVLTSTSKKALIPVEKDESYGYRDKLSRSRGKGDAAATARNQKRRRAANVEYEEVDIGSDEDAQGEVELSSSARAGGVQSSQRRSLPSYLQSKHAGEEDLPDQLPTRYKGTSMKAKPKQRSSMVPPTASSNTLVPRPTGTRPATAGKRPSMRPFVIDAHRREQDEEDDDSANGEFLDVDALVPDKAQSARPSFTAVNGAVSSSSTRNQTTVDEENRLAKLQALGMVDSVSNGSAKWSSSRHSGPQNGQGGVSMAEGWELSSDDDSGGAEEVSAR